MSGNAIRDAAAKIRAAMEPVIADSGLSWRDAVALCVQRQVGLAAHGWSVPPPTSFDLQTGQGEAYIFYTSPDGTGWNFVRSFALPCGGPVSVGFSAQAPFSEGFAADFSEVRYRTGTIRDYWQGE